MFKLKLLPEDFFNICIKRKVEIKKLDKLPKLDNTIFHYNHDAGEYTRSGFTNLGIDFSQFIQLA
ncbi:MAG: SMI1/KNR4 family protein, partial [Veillonella sp.]|nr:SMI1/KNR4 family protein [Veillonella sp.]